MYFDVSPDAYARFMGRYSEQLAAAFADLAGVGPGQQALDVGCGPGVLTAELVRRLGPEAVTAIDPSESFVAAVRARWPEADVRLGTAEELPFDDGAFDVALAQLVVHFMADPVAGLKEMARVTRPGGRVVVLAPAVPRAAVPPELRQTQSHRFRLLGTWTRLWCYDRGPVRG